MHAMPPYFTGRTHKQHESENMAKQSTSTPAPIRQPIPQIKPLRIRKCDACKLLGISRNGLHLIQQRDPSFPKEIKDGSAKQAPAYFITAEIDAWLAAQIAKRDGLTVGGV